MKTKELSRKLCEKVIEKYKSGDGYKTFPKHWTSPGVQLHPSLKNGRNMAHVKICLEQAELSDHNTMQEGD